jgi:tetratricopeptide (TPR) repeat protein
VVHELIQRGWAEQQAGRLSSAKTLYEQALKIEPRHPDALNLLGVIALQGGQPEEAAQLIGRAIRVQPSNPGFHANLAQAFLAVRRFADARDAFRRAARLDPRNPQFPVGAAVCLAEQGLAAEAERDLRSITRAHPDYALAWYNLGNVLRNQQRHEEAAESYRRAIRLDPSFADAYTELGRILHLAQRFDDAEQAYRQSLALQPDAAGGYVNLASLLIDRGRPADAATLCRQGIGKNPGPEDASGLQSMLGSARARQGDLAGALAAFRAATALFPGNSRALWGCGVALLESGDVQGGLRCFERARALEPDSAETRNAMAGTYLSLGNMQAGWEEYLHRPARDRFVQKYPQVEFATEASPDSLRAKTVLLLREQGLGDELFFLRYAAQLKSRGAAITYRASAKIASLLARVRVLDQVVTEDDPFPAADLALLVGDLPRILGPLDAAPYRPPQDAAMPSVGFQCLPRIFHPELPPPLDLPVLPRRLQEIKERLSGLGPPPYLGLTWRAGTAPEQQKGAVWVLHKEIPLERLGSAMHGVKGTLLALQRNPRPGEIEALSARAAKPVHDLAALNEDLEAMLALLALVDEYIGVSNTNFHLRAGVSRNARVLVPRPAEWRWLLAGDESPWFPGFRIYRQGSRGGWSNAFELLEHDLRALFGS